MVNIMLDLNAIHDIPSTVPSYAARESSRKRKRKSLQSQVQEIGDGESLPTEPDENTEYTAVITPDERLQRRLAGHPLNAPPPSHPFPHAAATKDSYTGVGRPPGQDQWTSLRLQHLAATVTLLHRCLEVRDYARASQALALILRSEVHGRLVDLRRAGLWGIGAEILSHSPAGSPATPVSREGLDKAKQFYDRMALQHPWHRTWPHAINAQDFKLAMFGLWINTVSNQSTRLQNLDCGDAPAVEGKLRAKQYELAEAEKIAKEMDVLIGTVPFIDDKELTRLRAHVALWCADLSETVDLLETELVSDTSLEAQQMEQIWLGQVDSTGSAVQAVQQSNEKAAVAREKARTLFLKLGHSLEDDFSDIEQNIVQF